MDAEAVQVPVGGRQIPWKGLFIFNGPAGEFIGSMHNDSRSRAFDWGITVLADKKDGSSLIYGSHGATTVILTLRSDGLINSTGVTHVFYNSNIDQYVVKRGASDCYVWDVAAGRVTHSQPYLDFRLAPRDNCPPILEGEREDLSWEPVRLHSNPDLPSETFNEALVRDRVVESNRRLVLGDEPVSHPFPRFDFLNLRRPDGTICTIIVGLHRRSEGDEQVTSAQPLVLSSLGDSPWYVPADTFEAVDIDAAINQFRGTIGKKRWLIDWETKGRAHDKAYLSFERDDAGAIFGIADGVRELVSFYPSTLLYRMQEINLHARTASCSSPDVGPRVGQLRNAQVIVDERSFVCGPKVHGSLTRLSIRRPDGSTAYDFFSFAQGAPFGRLLVPQGLNSDRFTPLDIDVAEVQIVSNVGGDFMRVRTPWSPTFLQSLVSPFGNFSTSRPNNPWKVVNPWTGKPLHSGFLDDGVTPTPHGDLEIRRTWFRSADFANFAFVIPAFLTVAAGGIWLLQRGAVGDKGPLPILESLFGVGGTVSAASALGFLGRWLFTRPVLKLRPPEASAPASPLEIRGSATAFQELMRSTVPLVQFKRTARGEQLVLGNQTHLFDDFEAGVVENGSQSFCFIVGRSYGENFGGVVATPRGRYLLGIIENPNSKPALRYSPPQSVVSLEDLYFDTRKGTLIADRGDSLLRVNRWTFQLSRLA